MEDKKTLVLGVSLNPSRYSNLAVQRLVAHNIETKAFGLKAGVVAGVGVDTELQSYEDIHTVSLYLNPLNQKPFYDYIVALNPQRVIFNPGTENPEFYDILKANNIAFEVACTLVLLSINQF